MMEAAVVLDPRGYPIFNHYPPDRSSVSLPDSVLLWEVIWTNKDEISGIAHSHPGKGHSPPSHTDLTTFDAVERALGRRLDWWILTEDGLTLTRWTGTPDPYTVYPIPTFAFPWVRTLRHLSRMEG